MDAGGTSQKRYADACRSVCTQIKPALICVYGIAQPMRASQSFSTWHDVDTSPLYPLQVPYNSIAASERRNEAAVVCRMQLSSSGHVS